MGKMMRNYFEKARERSWKIYSKYYGDDKYRNPEARYLEELAQRLTSDSVLLDAGSGADMVITRQLAPKVRMAVGADIAPIVFDSPSPYGVRADVGKLPFKDSSFDIITSMSVIEHLPYPEAAFRELSRVLKPGGVAVIQTPNAYDYVSIVARLTPLWFHQRILSNLLDRKEEDTFRTFFNANSKKRILSLLAESNLVPLKLHLFNQYPAYLMFSPFLFRLGIFYERVTSRFDFCAQLRAWILFVAKKDVD